MSSDGADVHDLTSIDKGTVLDGRYEILERLGAGTMGFVARAHDRETDWTVACKIPLDLSAQRTDALLDQYRKLVALGSPHLPAVLGLARHRTGRASFQFLVLELVDGMPLEKWCLGKSLRMRLEVLASLAQTVAALAADGQSHGDLFVGNVLVRADGRVVLIDPDAERFGSLVLPKATSSEQRGDHAGLRSVIEDCTSEAERDRLATMLRRLDVSEPAAPDAAELAAALRQLLTFPLLPGETSADRGEFAGSYTKRTGDNLAICGRIMQVRDLVFRNTTDLLRHVSAPFGLKVTDGDSRTAPDTLLLQRELESLAAARATLLHRNLECISRAGDKLMLTFGGGDFRIPWPHPDRPGLLAMGWFNILRDNSVLVMQRLELREAKDTPVLFVADDPWPTPFDEAVLDRSLRILLEAIYPGLQQPVAKSDPANDPGLPTIKRDFLLPSFDALGIQRHRSPQEWLRAAMETALRLPQHSNLGNGVFGCELCKFFEIVDDYDAQLKLVRNAAQTFSETHGHYFSPLYRLDVRISDSLARRLRVDLVGRIHSGDVVNWTFDFVAESDSSSAQH